MKNILLLTVSLVITSLGCSKRMIVESSSINLDPMPVEVPLANKNVPDPKGDLWNLRKLSLDTVWKAYGKGSRKAVVAILGTGVDYTHEDLARNILLNQSEWSKSSNGKQSVLDKKDDDGNGFIDDVAGYDFVEDDGFPYDRNGMGTAMAGVVGAVADNGVGVKGIMPEVSLLPVRFIDTNGQFMLPHLVQSLNYALMRKADVVLLHTPSYTFGSSASVFEEPSEMVEIEKETLRAAIRALEKENIPVVVSAGNNGALINDKNSILDLLKTFSNVVIVTSIDETNKRPFIANYGMAVVHTTAPGVNIYTTQPGGSYAEMSGTALAASHVAGALGLAVANYHGKFTAQKLIQNLLKDQASDEVPGLQFEVMGGNTLNIKKFLDTLGK